MNEETAAVLARKLDEIERKLDEVLEFRDQVLALAGAGLVAKARAAVKARRAVRE